MYIYKSLNPLLSLYSPTQICYDVKTQSHTNNDAKKKNSGKVQIIYTLRRMGTYCK